MKRSRRLPARMLVDLPNWVGDQMMAMPAVHRLVDANRSGETVLHTRPPMLRLLAEVFPDAEVVASPRKASPLFSARMACEKGGRFSVGVTLRNAARAKILIRLAGRWTTGSRGEGAQILLTAPCSVDRSRHQIHDADTILAALELDAVDTGWCPSLSADLKAEGRSALRWAGVDQMRAIGVAPSTARGKAKRWPSRRYGELALRLRARGYEPVAVIGPGEESVARKVCEAAGREIPVIGGNMDVAGLAAVVASLRLLVGNDSGPMQLAARLGTPVVAIFGATDPDRTAPLGVRSRVLSSRSSRDDRMRGISVDEVEAAAVDLDSGELNRVIG